MCWVIGCTANYACQSGENESQGKANVQGSTAVDLDSSLANSFYYG